MTFCELLEATSLELDCFALEELNLMEEDEVLLELDCFALEELTLMEEDEGSLELDCFT